LLIKENVDMTQDMTNQEKQPLKSFGDIYPDKTIGVLTMFDRLIFKGYLSGLYPVKKQFDFFLWRQGVLLKGYKEYAEKSTAQLRDHLQQMAEEAGCSIQYLRGGSGPTGESKEELAQAALAAAGNKPGLVAV